MAGAVHPRSGWQDRPVTAGGATRARTREGNYWSSFHLLDLLRERIDPRRGMTGSGSPPRPRSRGRSHCANRLVIAPGDSAAPRSVLGRSNASRISITSSEFFKRASSTRLAGKARLATERSGGNRWVIRWPHMGRSGGRERGVPTAAYGEVSMVAVSKLRVVCGVDRGLRVGIVVSPSVDRGRGIALGDGRPVVNEPRQPGPRQAA